MNSDAASFEQAIVATGYGRFHYSLALCCSIIILAVGFQNGLSAYIIPIVEYDLNLTSAQKGYFCTSFFIGGLCSAFLWGLLADLYGRRKLLIYTLLADGLTTICASLSQTFLFLTFFHFTNGFLIGAPGTLIYSYFAEFQPEHLKSKAICFIGTFFTLAWIFLPVITFLMLPFAWRIEVFGFVYNSWRLITAVLSIPSLVTGVCLIFFPESPKFLFVQGQSKQALIVLKHMFSKNTGQSMDNFPVKVLTDNVQSVVKEFQAGIKNVGRGKTVRLMAEAKEQLKLLFKPPLLSLTILISAIFFTNMFGYLGLGLWLPEIINKFIVFTINYPNETITSCELYSNQFDFNLTIEINSSLYHNETLNVISTLDEKVLLNIIVMGSCCLFGNLLAIYLTNILNRKILPIVAMFIGTVSAIGIYWLNTVSQNLIVTSIFLASMSTSNIVLNGVVVELFPTTVSAMAVCTATFAGRLGAVVGNLTIGFLLDQSCEILLFTISATLLVGTFLGFFIPSEKSDLTNNIKNKTNESPTDIAIISS